ncbi:ISL3 family transposase [Lactiplantibacillus mudanjiangensis]|nr:ISL3 family transposase [Lactiplantibacillus mudanjiangensis]
MDYRPKACIKCGILNEKNNTKIINYGWRFTNVKLPRSGERDVKVRLKKRYFKCLECGSYFLAQTSLTTRNHTLSRNTELSCLEKLTETVSMHHIATKLNISSTTVLRILHSYGNSVKPHYNWLPAVINMDEIKSTRDAKGAMSFVFMDGMKRQFTDILESRTIEDLTKYFKRYTKSARDRVQIIITDMNYTYPKLVETVFPNAIVITDRFHIVNNVVVGFNQTRIRIMKKFAPSNIKYKALKRYWKLLLKPNGKLDISVYRNFTNIHGLNTENSVVETLLGFNKELNHAYEALQAVMSSVRLRDNSRLRIVLDPSQEYPEEMEKHLASLRTNQSFIENALRYKYSNGPLEGTNNKLKVLKRVAYGFKSFLNFRLRIHLMFSVKKVPSRKAARH